MTTCAKYGQDDQQQDQILLEEQKQNIWKLLTSPSSQFKSSATPDAGDSLGKLCPQKFCSVQMMGNRHPRR